MKVSLFLLSLVVPSTTTAAFGIGRPAVHPQLQKFANDYLGRLVDLRLDIGKKVSGHQQEDRLSLQGPIVKFLGGKQNSKDLEVVKQGFVIDINGMQDVKFNEGHWEMTWRESDNAGRIICEFDLEEPIQRNHVKIPPCRVHLVFPVWTKESLVIDQAIKKEVMQERQDLVAEKEAAIQKMHEATNPIRKAFLYRDAAACVEKMIYMKHVTHIPDNDDIIELANGLVMSKEGNLYKSAKAAFGANKKLFGSAVINLVDPAKADNKETA